MFYIPKIHHAFYNESKSIEINKLGRMALLLDIWYDTKHCVDTTIETIAEISIYHLWNTYAIYMEYNLLLRLLLLINFYR